LGLEVVWHGLENESIAKSINNTILEFRVEKTCKVLNNLGIQRDVVLSLIQEHRDAINDVISDK
jgi:hypothetical protein